MWDDINSLLGTLVSVDYTNDCILFMTIESQSGKNCKYQLLYTIKEANIDFF